MGLPLDHIFVRTVDASPASPELGTPVRSKPNCFTEASANNSTASASETSVLGPKKEPKYLKEMIRFSSKRLLFFSLGVV